MGHRFSMGSTTYGMDSGDRSRGAVGRLLLTSLEHVVLEQTQAAFWIWGSVMGCAFLGTALFLWAICLRRDHIVSVYGVLHRGMRTCALIVPFIRKVGRSFLRVWPRASDEPPVTIQDQPYAEGRDRVLSPVSIVGDMRPTSSDEAVRDESCSLRRSKGRIKKTFFLTCV